MGFFLIIPVRILLHPCFFVMLTLVITDIPELVCCIAHMSDEIRIFPADLYECFLWQQHFLSSIVSVSFALMFDIPADIFFRYRSDRFHIIGMVPQLPFPKLVSYFRKTFESFLPEIPFRYFTIAVMDKFGGADTKQCTWSPSPHSNRWIVKPLSSTISCTSSCRYASTSALNIFRWYFTDHTIW